MVQVHVQSSWFPLYDRNPQTYVPEVAKAPAEAYRAARQRVYVASDNASYVELPMAAPR